MCVVTWRIQKAADQPRLIVWWRTVSQQSEQFAVYSRLSSEVNETIRWLQSVLVSHRRNADLLKHVKTDHSPSLTFTKCRQCLNTTRTKFNNADITTAEWERLTDTFRISGISVHYQPSYINRIASGHVPGEMDLQFTCTEMWFWAGFTPPWSNAALFCSVHCDTSSWPRLRPAPVLSCLLINRRTKWSVLPVSCFSWDFSLSTLKRTHGLFSFLLCSFTFSDFWHMVVFTAAASWGNCCSGHFVMLLYKQNQFSCECVKTVLGFAGKLSLCWNNYVPFGLLCFWLPQNT